MSWQVKAKNVKKMQNILKCYSFFVKNQHKIIKKHKNHMKNNEQ